MPRGGATQVLSTFGLAVFFGLIWWAWKTNTRLWRRLAAVYATGTRPAARAAKPISPLVLFGGGLAFVKYAGVRMEVGEEGLWLRLFPPLAIYAPALFLPFDEMTVKPTSWYLNSESFALMMSRCPDIEVIVDDTTMEWLRASTSRI
jgi:hypothetical protein